MRNICLDCYKQKNPSDYSELLLISAGKGICEICNEEKYLVIKEESGYMIIH